MNAESLADWLAQLQVEVEQMELEFYDRFPASIAVIRQELTRQRSKVRGRAQKEGT